MKIGIIGHVGHGSTTALGALIKAVEEKTGEKIECVSIHENEKEVFNQQIFEREPYIIQALDRSYTELPPIPKINHKRPYKFHR